jgi:hypothetical protein
MLAHKVCSRVTFPTSTLPRSGQRLPRTGVQRSPGHRPATCATSLGRTRLLFPQAGPQICSALQAYYQMTYVDRRITDPEQIICEDAGKLAHELAQTTGTLARSAVDAIFYSVRMWQYSGTHLYTAALAGYIVVAGSITTILQPNFGGLVRTTQELEGAYRAGHEGLRASIEPVALLGGMAREAEGIRLRLTQLVSHTKKVLRMQLSSGVATDFLLKYLGATAAVVLIVGPFFQGNLRPDSTLVGRAHMLSEMRYHTRSAPSVSGHSFLNVHPC